MGAAMNIPPAALEAGARATFKKFYKRSPVLPDDDDMMDLARIYARAAFVAMVEAWPGVNTDAVRCGTLILHLPKESRSGEA